MTKEKKEIIKKEVEALKEFKCFSCKHAGSANPYPPFPKVEEKDAKLTQKKKRKFAVIIEKHLSKKFI